MKHTSKYKFNLIETSDTFGPEALNQNTEAAETELARVEAQAGADKAALERADAANRTALEQALAAQKAELEKADAALKAAIGAGGKTCRIATGSYVGDGFTQKDHSPTVVTDFKPMVVFVGPADTGVYAGVFFRPYGRYVPLPYGTFETTWEERQVSWYSSSSSETMLNVKGTTYHYVVIGESL